MKNQTVLMLDFRAFQTRLRIWDQRHINVTFYWKLLYYNIVHLIFQIQNQTWKFSMKTRILHHRCLSSFNFVGCKSNVATSKIRMLQLRLIKFIITISIFLFHLFFFLFHSYYTHSISFRVSSKFHVSHSSHNEITLNNMLRL